MSTLAAPTPTEAFFDASRLQWERVACNLCGRDETEVYHRERLPYFGKPVKFTIVRCRHCGLVYTNPRLAESNTTYEYGGVGDETAVEMHARMKVGVFSQALRRIERLKSPDLTSRADTDIGKQRRAVRLLDVGCGSGHFLSAARQARYQVLGLEPAAVSAEYAIRKFNLEIIQKEVLDAELEPNGFDVITLWDVLEHVGDPKAVLRRCAGWVADGGILACRFPSARWQKFKATVFHRGLRWDRPVFSPTMHNYFFDVKPFAELAGQSGLSVVMVRTTPMEANTDNPALNAIKRAMEPALLAADRLGLHLGNLEAYCRKEPS